MVRAIGRIYTALVKYTYCGVVDTCSGEENREHIAGSFIYIACRGFNV